MRNQKRTEKETSTSIALNDSLYKAVKHFAVEENKTIKEVVSDALKSYLELKGVSRFSE